MDGILKLPRHLRRELVLLIAVKLALLAILYFLFFSPAHRPTLDLATHLLGAQSGQ